MIQSCRLITDILRKIRNTPGAQICTVRTDGDACIQKSYDRQHPVYVFSVFTNLITHMEKLDDVYMREHLDIVQYQFAQVGATCSGVHDQA